jgi:hypothetical protein
VGRWTDPGQFERLTGDGEGRRVGLRVERFEQDDP